MVGNKVPLTLPKPKKEYSQFLQSQTINSPVLGNNKDELTERNFNSACQSAISTYKPSSLSLGVKPLASDARQFTALSTDSWSPTTPTLL